MGNIYSRMVPTSSDPERLQIGSSVDPQVPCRLHQEHTVQDPQPGTKQDIRIDMKECSDMIAIGNVTAQVVNIQGNRKSIVGQSPGMVLGTLAQETLQLRIKEAGKTFVEAKSFPLVKSKLDQFGHVTICGASGEGKTTMALMLARDYMKNGYEVMFVEKVDGFDFNQCTRYARKLFLVADDIFGTVGLSTDVTHLRNLLNSLSTHIEDCNQRFDISQTTKEERNSQDQMHENRGQDQDKKIKEIRVVFTSKTYNFKDGISKLYYQKLSLFTDQTVVDLTANKKYCYSDVEKLAIFESYKTMHGAVEEIAVEDLSHLDRSLFGFPLTCRLFFEFVAFISSAQRFFKQPLDFLRIELQRILKNSNQQSAALILMLLCEGELELFHLETQGRDTNMDEIFERVTDIVPAATRTGIATAARHFRGTFFHGGDALRFAHPSIYDACACALFQSNPTFILSHCSYDFLYERLEPETVEESKILDHLNIIFISDSYHDLIATRLADGMKQGHFAKTVTQPMLKNERFVQLLLQKLQAESGHDSYWIRYKDKEKGFLHWAVQGHSSFLVREIEKRIGITFTQFEISEALDGCVEKDNLFLLEFLLCKIDGKLYPFIGSRLLLLNAKNGRWEIAEYLLNMGADIKFSNTAMQNYIHLVCKFSRPMLLINLQKKIGSLVPENDHLLAMKDFDIHGRTPAMVASLYGSWECFELCDISDLDTRDKYGHLAIHLACIGGNRDIVQHVLTSDNINSTGRHGWTPVMYAALCGHQHVFEFLQSNNADLTLVDDYAENLLHLSCQGGNIDIVQRVLPLSNIDCRGRHGCTPVMIAAVCGNVDVFHFLLSRNADLTVRDTDGNDLLHLACQGLNKSIVQHVLTSSNINSRGEHEWTPLMYAAVSGQQSMFDFLVCNSADLTLVDANGNNLLHLASRGGSIDIVQHVLTHMTQTDLDSRGMHGWTPVMYAVVYGHQHVFDFLVSQHAELTLLDDHRDSLLHLACQGGNRDIVKELLTRANINSRGMYGWTPVMKAAADGHLLVFDYIVSNNADLKLVDDSSNSLIHLACQGGNRAIAQRVLTPFNINSRGKNEWTPVMMAAYCGHRNIIDLLVENQADLSILDKEGRDVFCVARLSPKSDVSEHLKHCMLRIFHQIVVSSSMIKEH